MGSFMNHEPVESMLPELTDFLNKTFGVKDFEVWVQFFREDEQLSVRFHGGEYNLSERNLNWKINPRLTSHDYSGEFSLTTFPGNSNIAISHGLFLNDKMRGKGVGKFLQNFKKEIAKNYLISVMYCTTLQSNSPENHVLQKNGWEVVGISKNQMDSAILEWRVEIE